MRSTMILMKDIGIRIRKLRTESGYTQEQVARAIGITPGAISQLERGETNGMSFPHLKAAAKFFRVDLDWLATGNGDQNPKALSLVLSDEAIMLADEIDRLDPQQAQIIRAMIQQFRKK